MSTENDSGGMITQTALDRELLTRALMEWSGRSFAQVEQFLAGRSEGELMGYRNSPKVKLIFERLESESQQTGMMQSGEEDV